MNNKVISWDERDTPVSILFGDVYFNSDGAVNETTYVFIDGNNINDAFLAHSRDTFIVAETGFGSGLSFLILWQTFLQFKRNNPEHILKKLIFYSVEKYPLSKQELTEIYTKVLHDKSLIILGNQLKHHWPFVNQQFNDVNVVLLLEDVAYFPSFLQQQNCLIDAWFFDGFSPQKNTAMWDLSLFKQCYQLTANLGTFATFTAASTVRHNLINAGFDVEKRKGFGVKREMLIGQKRVLLRSS